VRPNLAEDGDPDLTFGTRHWHPEEGARSQDGRWSSTDEPELKEKSQRARPTKQQRVIEKQRLSER